MSQVVKFKVRVTNQQAVNQPIPVIVSKSSTEAAQSGSSLTTFLISLSSSLSCWLRVSINNSKRATTEGTASGFVKTGMSASFFRTNDLGEMAGVRLKNKQANLIL